MRAIDADALKKDLTRFYDNEVTAKQLIDEQPTIEPEPRWIKCSERLPNLDDFTGSKRWQRKVLITGYLSFDDTKDLAVSEAFASDVIHNCVHDTVVVAWMPLPKVYRDDT